MLAMMMNPTGSIVGPANQSVFIGDVHDSLVCHAIVHDAFGYLHNFHRLGPGYNYLNTCDIFHSNSPLCCQFQGWAAATKVLKRWHMCGNRGRTRRKAFMDLLKKIPKLQSHEELELTHAFSRRLVDANLESEDEDSEMEVIDLEAAPALAPSSSGYTPEDPSMRMDTVTKL